LLTVPSSHLSQLYDINIDSIPFEKRVSQVVPLFPQISYLENPDRVIKKFYISAFNEKRITTIINRKIIRRRNVSHINLPTMKHLKELLQDFIDNPDKHYEIFGYRHKIKSYDEFTSLNSNKLTTDSDIDNNSDSDSNFTDSTEELNYLWSLVEYT